MQTMIAKCPWSRFKSLNIASIQHTRSHTPKKTNFKIAAAKVIVLAETSADGGIPWRTRNGLAHDASIGGPLKKKVLLRWWLFGSFFRLLVLVKKRVIFLVVIEFFVAISH